MIEVKVYKSQTGYEPLHDWLQEIKDVKTKNIILKSLTKLQTGLIGNTAPVGGGVMELKIHYGCGYRIYYGYHNNNLIILLCAGDKSTQKKDILKAKDYWNDYLKDCETGGSYETHQRLDRSGAEKE
ncbi:MAG: type II toxin-antitoxin system RelE/ParE family toxin [Alphaproteobacteria bacterium]|nr:type II toxin-antitoxin system RelE/ParE family toxin [Alphaproteobacteria bacterium]